MTRAERRRAERTARKKQAVYNYTDEQLEQLFQDWAKNNPRCSYSQGKEDGMRDALALMLALPIEVLITNYEFTKDDVGEFTTRVLDLYESWMNDEVDMEKIRKDVWEYGGVEIVPTKPQEEEENELS